MAAPVAMVLLAEHHLGWLADPLIIIIGFPLVIWAAVSVQIPAMVRPAAELGGFLSYPVYALQTPMQFAAIALFRRLGWEHSHKAWLGFGVAVVAVCWLIGRYYDVPLRDWLARWPRSKAAAIQP
jgi:peptidoglycan/LPS O-acetylase OafA/YrhL